jgi:gamma-glutamylcyclotransferase (GGCT)/AIG2-like uncharacterized protein YtfP
MTTSPANIFVYGTLKRGECREACWPRPPLEVIPATVRGLLYDMGPYPALAEGDGWVAGEIWRLESTDVATTLAALDQIECYGIDDVDLYVRKVVSCSTSSDRCTAHAYFLADVRQLAGLAPLAWSPDLPATWSGLKPK